MVERYETGRCFCGEITAGMHGEPFWICFDHDSDCRRATGGAVIVWIGYRPDQFKILTGEPRRFSRTKGVVRTFCESCGTTIGYVDEGIPDEHYVSIGFVDQPEKFRPMAHAYWREKLPWLNFEDSLKRIDTYSRERDAALGYPADRGNS